jgi:putative inorganic carbon (HCO3(-)) transporter
MFAATTRNTKLHGARASGNNVRMDTLAFGVERMMMLTSFTVSICAVLVFSPQFMYAYSDVKLGFVAFASALLLPGIFAATWRVARGGIRWPSACFAATSGMLLLIALVSALTAVNRFEALKGVGFLAGCVGIALCGLSAGVSAQEQTGKVAWLCAMATAVVGAYGILQYLGFDFVNVAAGEGEKSRYSGKFLASTLGSGVFSAQYLCGALPLICAGMVAWCGWRRVVFGVCALLGGAHLLLAQARAGFIALAVGLLVFGCWLVLRHARTRRSRIRFVLASIAVLLIATAGAFATGLVSRFVMKPGSAQAFSTNYRVQIWRNSLRLTEQFPWTGVGYWNFDTVLPRYASLELHTAHHNPQGNERINRAHNDYLDIAAETGVPGFIAFLAVLGTLAAAARNLLRKRDAVMAGAVCSITAICTDSLFDFPLYNGASAGLFWLLAGLVVCEVSQGTRETTSVPAVPAFLRAWQVKGILITGCLLLSLAGFLVCLPWYRYLVSQSLNREGLRFSASGRHREAVAAVTRSQATAPRNREVYSAQTTVFRRAGLPAQSGNAALQWIELEPYLSGAHNSLGYALASTGKPAEALLSFRRARELAPTNFQALLNMITASVLVGAYGEASQLAADAYSTDPYSSRQALLVAVDEAGKQGNKEAARALLRIMLTYTPDDAELRKTYQRFR